MLVGICGCRSNYDIYRLWLVDLAILGDIGMLADSGCRQKQVRLNGSLLRRYLTINRNTQGVMFSSDKNYWETPQWLYDQLDKEFHFTLDAAASNSNHKCDRYYTANDDGLAQDWTGQTVFVNPPYGNKETGEWTHKCYMEAQKPDTTVVLLIPARTDRVSFHNYIYDINTKAARPGIEIRFLKDRLKFEIDGVPIDRAPFPSMIVVFKNVQKQT